MIEKTKKTKTAKTAPIKNERQLVEHLGISTRELVEIVEALLGVDPSLLPPAARRVRDGGRPGPAYYAWLATEIPRAREAAAADLDAESAAAAAAGGTP